MRKGTTGKTRTPANNRKNHRRARVIKALEIKLKLGDKEMMLNSKSTLTPKEYRTQLTAHVEHLKTIQTAKGGTL